MKIQTTPDIGDLVHENKLRKIKKFTIKKILDLTNLLLPSGHDDSDDDNYFPIFPQSAPPLAPLFYPPQNFNFDQQR